MLQGEQLVKTPSSFDLVLLIGSFDSTNFELVHSGTADKVITPTMCASRV
jgi:hypothetical protein